MNEYSGNKKNVLIIEDNIDYFNKIQKTLSHSSLKIFPEIDVKNVNEFESFICDLRISLDKRSTLQETSKKELHNLIPFNNIDLIILDYELQPKSIKNGIHGINFINTYLTKNIDPLILFFTNQSSVEDYVPNNYNHKLLNYVEKKNEEKGIKFYDVLNKTNKWCKDGDSTIDTKLLSAVLNSSKEKGIFIK